MNNHLQYREDGSTDLVWFNTLSNEDQIILGGFLTEQQWLNYKVKKFELSKEEILGDDI